MKKIQLKVVYESFTTDGWIEINGERIKRSNRVEMGVTLDILKHLGYEVEFVRLYDTDEKIENL
jgi:ribosomal 50S subunit-recycling heat shock protein